MPTITIVEDCLQVHLSVLETILALQRSFAIPLTKVLGATDDPGFVRGGTGLRLPGTHVPGVLTAGTYYLDGDRIFIYLRPKQHPLVIEMKDHRFDRLVLGVTDARAMAMQINARLDLVPATVG